MVVPTRCYATGHSRCALCQNTRPSVDRRWKEQEEGRTSTVHQSEEPPHHQHVLDLLVGGKHVCCVCVCACGFPFLPCIVIQETERERKYTRFFAEMSICRFCIGV